MFTTDPITGQPRIIAEARSKRLGPKPDGCPFCVGNEHTTPPETDRLGGDDWTVRVVPNLFPLGEHHEVIVNTNRHITTTRDLTVAEWVDLVAMWQKRLAHYAHEHPNLYPHLFVNDGKGAGASLEHSHSQLLAVPRDESVAHLFSGVEYAGDCALCRWQSTPEDALIIARSDDYVLQVHPVPRVSGTLILYPTKHDNDFSAGSFDSRARFLHAAVHALPEADFNCWVVQEPVSYSHWYIELVPRVATPAGVELALGYGVSTMDLHEVAEQCRQRGAEVSA